MKEQNILSRMMINNKANRDCYANAQGPPQTNHA